MGSLYSLSLVGQVLVVAENLSQVLDHLGLHLLQVLTEPFKIGHILCKASCGFPKKNQ